MKPQLLRAISQNKNKQKELLDREVSTRVINKFLSTTTLECEISISLKMIRENDYQYAIAINNLASGFPLQADERL